MTIRLIRTRGKYVFGSFFFDPNLTGTLCGRKTALPTYALSGHPRTGRRTPVRKLQAAR